MHLNEKTDNYRELLKASIKKNRFETLFSILSDGFGELIRLVSFGTVNPGRLVSTFIFWFLPFFFLLLVHVVQSTNDFSKQIFFTTKEKSLTFADFLSNLQGILEQSHSYTWIWAGGAGLAMMVAADFHSKVFFNTLRGQVLGSIVTNEDLIDLKIWLKKSFSKKRQFLFCIFLSASMTFVTIVISLSNSLFITIPYVLLIFVTWFQGALGWYLIWPSISLINKLKSYDLKLNVINPSQSLLIDSLSDALITALFIGSTMGVYFTWGVIEFNIFSGFYSQLLFLVFLAWGPIISVFVLYHRGLNRIIVSAKYNFLADSGCLDSSQKWISTKDKTKIFKDKEEENSYYERIYDSANSAISTKQILVFVHTLILPLVTFAIPWILKMPTFSGSQNSLLIEPEVVRASAYSPLEIRVKLKKASNRKFNFSYSSDWGHIDGNPDFAIWTPNVISEQHVAVRETVRIDVVAIFESIRLTKSRVIRVNKRANLSIDYLYPETGNGLIKLSVIGGNDPDGDPITIKWFSSIGKFSNKSEKTTYLHVPKGTKSVYVFSNVSDGWESWDIDEIVINLADGHTLERHK